MVRKHAEFFCEQCNESFDNEHHAKVHEENCSLLNTFKCDKCSEEVDLSDDQYGFIENSCHQLDLGRMGYGSGLDGSEVQLNICDNCLIDLVDTFHIEARERIHNSGSNVYMSKEQWIRHEKGEMSDEEMESLGMYSNREIKAYEDRFPKCKHVKIVEFNDGSRHSECPNNAFGDENGGCNEYNPSSECFGCEEYVPREPDDEIRLIKDGELNLFN